MMTCQITSSQPQRISAKAGTSIHKDSRAKTLKWSRGRGVERPLHRLEIPTAALPCLDAALVESIRQACQGVRPASMSAGFRIVYRPSASQSSNGFSTDCRLPCFLSRSLNASTASAFSVVSCSTARTLSARQPSILMRTSTDLNAPGSRARRSGGLWLAAHGPPLSILPGEPMRRRRLNQICNTIARKRPFFISCLHAITIRV